MKILVIGKNGQLGNSLQEHAAQHLPDLEILSPTRTELDITNEEQLDHYIKTNAPQWVINTAAYNLLPASEKNPLPAFAINTVAPRNIANACKKYGARFITYSTDYVFNGQTTSPYTEDSRPDPLQMYGLSKYAGEQAVTHTNPDTIIIRTAGVYGGLAGSPSKGNFVLMVLNAAKIQDELVVGSHQIINTTWSNDLAVATMTLIAKNVSGGIYHLTNTSMCSWSEFAQAIVRFKNLPLQIIPQNQADAPAELSRPLFSALKNVKAAKIGIELQSWESALQGYLDTLPHIDSETKIS